MVLMKLVTVTEMQQVEREAAASGLSYEQMMQNAGTSLAEIVQAEHDSFQPAAALALIGPGNNGGDALVALSWLADRGWQVSAYLVRPRAAADPLIEQFVKVGGRLHSRAEDRDFTILDGLLKANSLLLDGILGTGTRLPLKPEIAEVLQFVKTSLKQQAGLLKVVAVDCPSGVDCDTGEAAPECLKADLTVSMAAAKQGLYRYPAAELVGDLRIATIGNLEALPAWKNLTRFVADDDWVRGVLPPRPATAHKGTFGTALVVAGSVNYTGAAWLAGQAAYRSGAGLVTLAVPFPLHAALAGQFPEATWLLLSDEMGVIAESAVQVVQDSLERATALLVGPGLGLEDTSLRFMEGLLGTGNVQKKTLGFAPLHKDAPSQTHSQLPPLVVDADGLKLLSRLHDWPRRLPAPTVLTPHPGEMAVLTGLAKEELLADRLATAEHFAHKWGHVVVFKGAYTVIAAPDDRLALIPVATPALARAGTGDVLAGLIVGLLAQGMGAFEAAVSGAWIHAQAGLHAARALGSTAAVLAGDVLNAVPAQMAKEVKV
jgi:NAD(P)H-hydrate epimerase